MKLVLNTPMAMADELKKLAKWEKEEHMAQYMLSQKLPNTIVVQIHKLDTVKKKWDLVKEEYTCKGLFAQADLWKSFMESQCLHGESVCHFLTDLGTRREELSMSGVTISNADYWSAILSSIPSWLKSYTMSIQASTSICDPMYSK